MNSDDKDQIARFTKELKTGDWLDNAQRRSQRRKSPWNLLLPLFGLPLWAAFAFLFVRLGELIHLAFNPALNASAGAFFDGPMRLTTGLIIFPSMLVGMFPAFMLANFLVYRIPWARRALEAEDCNSPADGYGPSQRAIFRMGVVAIVATLILIFVGAALG
ncbi:hypothetical protein [Rhodanobacter sp. L36]|uniref:hypothetical protein n=1 Tax=Rhodanobacter sp. L36 TaxID=1747221 RepID=UPI00131AE112|nr:hypothetical protein [Rhodanobacter sp. L36]